MNNVTMQIRLHIPEFARKEHNLHCDVVHITTKWVFRLTLVRSDPDVAIKAYTGQCVTGSRDCARRRVSITKPRLSTGSAVII